LEQDATIIEAATRSEFSSAKRDENGHVVTMTPLAVDLLVEAQYPDQDARDRAVGRTGEQLRDLAGRAGRAGPAGIDWQFLPGPVHDVIPGGGAVTVAFLAARRPELTRPAFHDYWLNHHALIARQVPNGPSYRQLHVQPDPSDRSTDVGRAARLELARWDGVTTMKYASYEALAAGRASAIVAVTAFLDEQTFIDHARSSMAFFDAIEL
jgi:hypothetical protein